MKSPHDFDWHRLVRYLSGEYPSSKEEELQAWIVDDEDRARLMDELNRIWNATDESVPPRDVEAAWQELRATLRSDEDETPERTALDRSSRSDWDPRSSVQRSRTRRRFLRMVMVVALVAITALLSIFLLRKSWLVSPSSDTKAFTTKKGQRAVIRLADGTQVHLNVDSRLTLSAEAFATGPREVHLEGEAYFEVAGDTGRPFIVHSKGATAEVLGTAFDVKAYADDNEVQVAVTEGKVALRPVQHGGMRDTVLLQPHHLGVVAGQQVQAVHRGVDLSEQLAWKEGRLVFKDAPFRKVTQKLARWYDLRVESGVTPTEVDRLNATFDDESLGEALRAVATALDLKYERDGRAVTFFRPNAGA